MPRCRTPIPWPSRAWRPVAVALACVLLAACSREPTDEQVKGPVVATAPAPVPAPEPTPAASATSAPDAGTAGTPAPEATPAAPPAAAAASGAGPATSAAAEPAAGAASSTSVAAHEPEAEAPAAPETHDADSALPTPAVRPADSVGHLAGLHRVPDPLRLRSSVAYVIDAGNRDVLLAKNEGAVLPIASLTKLMTALVVRDAKQPLDEVLTITEEDVDNEKHSRSRLRVGTTLTRDEALRLALMSSENRAAHALGRTYPGGLDAFLRAMNAKAKQLALGDTKFNDPTGLSSANQSTARDLAKLVAAADKDPLVRSYSTTHDYMMPVGRRMLTYRNSNRLVKREDWQIALQKTGYTTEAGQCLVMHTRLGERDTIVVLLDAADKASRARDAERIRSFVSGEPMVEAKPAKRAVAKSGGGKKKEKKEAVAKAAGKGKVAKAKSKETATHAAAAHGKRRS